MRRSSLRPVPVVVLTVLALLAGAALDVVARPVGSGTTGAATVPSGPSAGGAVCMTGAGPLRTDADVLLVAAPGTPPMEDVAARGALLTFGTDPGPGSRSTEVDVLGPGGTSRAGVTLGPEGWLWVGWADRPVLGWQEWSTPGAPGDPAGTVASRCLPVDPPVQTVLGLSTAEGDEALLRLANPFTADATFAVTLVTPSGALEPVALRNVSVRAGTRTTLRLNDHAPEQRDLAAIVTVGAGRLAVEGLQRSVAAVGGVDGLAGVPPVATPALAWTVPWLPSGPDTDGIVWILNPAPRDVVVEVTVHTPEGASVPEGTASIEVGPGELRRVDAVDVAADDRPVLALTLRSQTTGILVATGARFRADDAARTGLVRTAASSLPDAEWVVAGVTAPGRRTVLHIVNLSEEVVEPSIALTSLPDPVATEEPSTEEPSTEAVAPAANAAGPVTVTLTPVPIAAGAVGRVVLPLDVAGAWSAVVSGGPGLVVSRTTFGDEQLAPVAIAAVPSRAWRTVPAMRSGRVLEGWVAGLGTARDLRRSALSEVPGMAPDLLEDAG